MSFDNELTPYNHHEENTIADSAILGSIGGELSPRSLRVYTADAKAFAAWLQDNGVASPETLDRATMTRYRGYLAGKYKPATAKRMFSVARRILDEQVYAGRLATNPAKNIKGIKAEDESPHIALTKQEAVALLASIDRRTRKGKRDYAIVCTLLYTGLRRFEAAALTIGDISMEQGHNTLTVQSGKGGRRDRIKLRVEARRAINEYLEAAGRAAAPAFAPLFVQFGKWDNPIERGISPMVIYRLILHYATASGLEAHLTPHGMRASFITLSVEGGASLIQTQDAARHKDPRTTERYIRRRNRLDDNAVDYIHL